MGDYIKASKVVLCTVGCELLSLLPWELAEADRTSRVKREPGKPGDSRTRNRY